MRAAGWIFICYGVVRAAGQTSAVRAVLRARICQNMRGGVGCGPNGTVEGRVRAQLFQPAQFLSKFVHCLCLSVGGLPDSSLCVCVCVCVCVSAWRACVGVYTLCCLHDYTCAAIICCACVDVFIHVCAQLDVVHSCMCVWAFML